ncbi:hypothetical protein Q4493_02310 [Colwellia sp. 1_MG-2023]|uniref:hypothetical protein n=1 Tax=Colwellia sp. 1_MG-2023 TaxID=3062649 RepID=UPI0026E4042A|nr:hypothetical protein [Colwellia sp. 1_MG-2023]MDO6444600.1 hypothetical protein [Colwellia sp. 1_MG-2023]
MKIYSKNDSFVWIPVSQVTKTYTPRAFLPVKGLEEEYGYGYKAERSIGTYFDALIDIQQAFKDKVSKEFIKGNGDIELQFKARWWHKNPNGDSALLEPKHWVELPVENILAVDEKEISELIGSSTEPFITWRTYKEKRAGISNRVVESNSIEQPSSTEDVTIDEYIDATNEIDKKVEVLVRTEQAFLREKLFNSHDIATCCICNSPMPIKFLVTAHIKKRSLCTDAEKRDYKNIVTPMCKFGCDELYERGFIAVHGGHVINLKTPSNGYGYDYFNEYLKKITGQKCNTYTPKSSSYFEWHYNKHKSVED